MAFTPYPELDEVLQELLAGSRNVLADNFLGLYLHGSLAAGDFNQVTSDVDFVVVVHEEVRPDRHVELEHLLLRLTSLDHAWAQRLEGSFLPVSKFREPDPEERHPSFDEGSFSLDHKGIYNAMQRHVLREHGIVLAGPEPHTFIAQVSAEELRAESLHILHGWWEPKLQDSRHLLDPDYRRYAILTMCRILYTLETGAVASKPLAAEWAVAQLDGEWRPLISAAMNAGSGAGGGDLPQVLGFIRYTLELAAAPRETSGL